jgi:hypothetical protein
MGRYYAASRRHARRECIGTARTRLQFPPRPTDCGHLLQAAASSSTLLPDSTWDAARMGAPPSTRVHRSAQLAACVRAGITGFEFAADSTLHSTARRCDAIQYSTVHCSAVQCSGVQYSAVQQCSAVHVLCCAVLRCASSAGQVLTHSPVVLSSAPSLASPSPDPGPILLDPRARIHLRTHSCTHPRTY